MEGKTPNQILRVNIQYPNATLCQKLHRHLFLTQMPMVKLILFLLGRKYAWARVCFLKFLSGNSQNWAIRENLQQPIKVITLQVTM